ncbi:MAG: alpha/beta hydrolase [Pseudomonadota bacterium]
MRVEVNGVRLFVDVDGEALTPDGMTMREKPTVIMVHGGPGSDHTVAKPFFSQLTDIAQVVYYDHRGNGRSDRSDEEKWNLAQWGDDLKGLCDALGIEKPIVVGTSFGGFVTQSYATRYPDHAAGIVLISTAAKVDFSAIYQAFERRGGPEIREIAEAYWTHPTDAGREVYKERCVPLYRYRNDGPPVWISRVLWINETALWFNGPNNEHGRMDFRGDLSRITCPTLVVAGEDDPIMPSEFSDVIAEAVGSAQVELLKFEQCGHGVFGDKPNEALAAIRTFIQAVSMPQ